MPCRKFIFFFFPLSSRVKSGPLAVVVLRKWKSCQQWELTFLSTVAFRTNKIRTTLKADVLVALSSVFAIIFAHLLFLHSFKHSFGYHQSVQFLGIYRFRFWVHGLHSFLQYLKAFSSHDLAIFEYDFCTLRHSLAGSGVMAGLYNDLVHIL